MRRLQQQLDGALGVGLDGAVEGQEAGKDQVALGLVAAHVARVLLRRGRQPLVGQGDDAGALRGDLLVCGVVECGLVRQHRGQRLRRALRVAARVAADETEPVRWPRLACRVVRVAGGACTLTATSRPVSPSDGFSTAHTTAMRFSCEEKANRRTMRIAWRPSGDLATLPARADAQSRDKAP